MKLNYKQILPNFYPRHVQNNGYDTLLLEISCNITVYYQCYVIFAKSENGGMKTEKVSVVLKYICLPKEIISRLIMAMPQIQYLIPRQIHNILSIAPQSFGHVVVLQSAMKVCGLFMRDGFAQRHFCDMHNLT